MLHYPLTQPLDLEKYISVLMKSLAEKIVPKNNKSRLGVVQKSWNEIVQSSNKLISLCVFTRTACAKGKIEVLGTL